MHSVRPMIPSPIDFWRSFSSQQTLNFALNLLRRSKWIEMASLSSTFLKIQKYQHTKPKIGTANINLQQIKLCKTSICPLKIEGISTSQLRELASTTISSLLSSREISSMTLILDRKQIIQKKWPRCVKAIREPSISFLQSTMFL